MTYERRRGRPPASQRGRTYAQRSVASPDRSSSPQHERRREELIGLAVYVFSRYGYVGGTTTEIARRAGLTQPALYHYVGGKHAFLEEICSRVGQKLQTAMDEILAADLTPRERLSAFLRAHTSIVLAERESFRIYVTEAFHLPSRTRERIRSDERKYHDNVTAIVAAAIEAGDLVSTSEPWLLAQMLVGAASWPFRWYREQVKPDEVADALMGLIFGST